MSDRVRLDFRGGGWALALAGLLCLGLLGWKLVPALISKKAAGTSHRSIEGYGFDLTDLRVSRDSLIAGPPKDQMDSMSDPAFLSVEYAKELSGGRTKMVVSGDLVVGVAIGGEARAYPIQTLNWHEMVNDELGGEPIGIAYHPLTDAVLVFSRRISGSTLEFGNSGLIYNSEQLLYDRAEDASQQSLWSRIQAAAISGSHAGTSLQRLPYSLVTWEEWIEDHPETTLLARHPGMSKFYKQGYGVYRNSEKLNFPVEPLPATGWKDQVVVLIKGESRLVVPYPAIAEKVNEEGQVVIDHEGESITLEYREDPDRVVVRGSSEVLVAHAFRFAWYAAHPDDPVWGS